MLRRRRPRRGGGTRRRPARPAPARRAASRRADRGTRRRSAWPCAARVATARAASLRSTRARSARPSASTLSRRARSAIASSSTNTAEGAPREIASMPTAPEPANRSRKGPRPTNGISVSRQAMRTWSAVGRVVRPRGVARRRPLSSPARTRMFNSSARWRRGRAEVDRGGVAAADHDAHALARRRHVGPGQERGERRRRAGLGDDARRLPERAAARRGSPSSSTRTTRSTWALRDREHQRPDLPRRERVGGDAAGGRIDRAAGARAPRSAWARRRARRRRPARAPRTTRRCRR